MGHMEHKIRLLLVDDHTLFREGLARLLEAESGLELVGHVASGDDALGLLEQQHVDVILLDFELGEKNGLHFFRAFQERSLHGKILLVTGGMSDADTLKALRQGASGIFLKHNPPADLVTAIRRVARGETWLDPSSVNSLVGSVPVKETTQRIPMLNEREQAVLKCV